MKSIQNQISFYCLDLFSVFNGFCYGSMPDQLLIRIRFQGNCTDPADPEHWYDYTKLSAMGKNCSPVAGSLCRAGLTCTGLSSGVYSPISSSSPPLLHSPSSTLPSCSAMLLLLHQWPLCKKISGKSLHERFNTFQWLEQFRFSDNNYIYYNMISIDYSNRSISII